MSGKSNDTIAGRNVTAANQTLTAVDYMRMVELAGDVIYTTNRGGYFTYVNSRIQALLGYLPEAVVGQHYLALVSPSHHEAVTNFYREQFESHIRETSLEFPAMTHDGEEKWVEQIAILLVEEGQTVGVQATVRDITPRQQARIALVEERDLLRTLLDTIPDAVYVKDVNGRIIINNMAHVRLLGAKSFEDVQGKTAADFYTEEMAEQVQNSDRTIIETGKKLLNVEEGDPSRWLSTSKVPLRNHSGDIYRIVGISRDITTQKRIEAELSKQLEQLTILQRVNRELTKTLNIDHVLEIAMDIALRLSRADVGFVGLVDDMDEMQVVKSVGNYPQGSVPYTQSPEDLINRVLTQQQPELVTDVMASDEHYSLIPNMRAQLAIPLISQQRLLGVICLETHTPESFTHQTVDFLHLITGPITVGVDNARLYALSQEQLTELKDLYGEVSRLEQLKSDMIRIAAHDLRNPIHVMRGYLSLLRKTIYDQIEAADRGRFEQIHSATERMERIITDILSLQRIEQAAKGELTEQVDLTQLITEAIDEYHAQADEKSQVFTHHLPDETLIVLGDNAQLREAIGNLIGNAIKYTPQDGSVTVRLKQSENAAHLEVQDTGYGIPEEMQTKLFQPFYRATTDETADIEGTGLGLHLVKNIIERHHGRLTFNSVHGEGSTFGVVLPLTIETPV